MQEQLKSITLAVIMNMVDVENTAPIRAVSVGLRLDDVSGSADTYG